MASKETKTSKKKKKSETPLSEIENKIANGTREELIADLRRIAEADPDAVISRNFYRVHGKYKESAWTGTFGTFQEFKRQANIILSRHQNRLSLNVAKHAAADSYRQLNIDKAGWEDKYLKPHGKRFQSILIASDIHDKECDPFYRRSLIDTLARVQPEKFVLSGDIFDLYEFGKYTQDPRAFDVVGRIKWVHEFLNDCREAAPDTEIVFIEGNHEFRLLRHLSEATPALKAVLSDLHGFTVPQLLGLDKFEVNYISRSDLAAFREVDVKKEIGKNWHLFYDCLIGSHYPHDRRKGIPGWNGHHHSHLVWHNYSPIYGPYEWHQIGSGHKRQADYTDGEKWSNGFLLAHVDTETKHSQFEYIDVTFAHAVIGGKWYERDATEVVTAY